LTGGDGGGSTMIPEADSESGSGFHLGHAGSLLLIDRIFDVVGGGVESFAGRRRCRPGRFIDWQALHRPAHRTAASSRVVARRRCYLLATRSLQVGDRRAHEVDIVIVMAETAVAFPAKQAAHLASRMTMVDAERALLLADRTSAALARQHRGTIVQGHAVAMPEPFSCFRPPARLGRILVSRPPREIRKPLLSILRVFGIPLSCPNGPAGNHVCSLRQSR
jgi:hypothetical protein